MVLVDIYIYSLYDNIVNNYWSDYYNYCYCENIRIIFSFVNVCAFLLGTELFFVFIVDRLEGKF